MEVCAAEMRFYFSGNGVVCKLLFWEWGWYVSYCSGNGVGVVCKLLFQKWVVCRILWCCTITSWTGGNNQSWRFFI